MHQKKFFQIVKGASAFIWTRLQHLEIWTSQEFWETYFFAKASEMCLMLYSPSLFEMLQTWHLKTSEEKEQISTAEVESVWKLLSSFAFKMSSLAVPPHLIKKFSVVLCNRAQLDEEHRKSFLILSHNMTRLSELDVISSSPT